MAYNRLVFPAAKQVVCEGFTPPEVGAKQVRVRSLRSLMSTGTENIVFNRLFDPGTHWDNWVKYPFFPGYSTIAEVEAVGTDVTSLKVGDRIACRTPHGSHHVVAESACFPVPKGLDPAEAAWFALAKITFIGARAAEYRIGDEVLIVGAGPIGQMSVRWARVLGAGRIAVVDPVAQRLTLATAGGATTVAACPIADAADVLKNAFTDGKPRVAIDGTGHPVVFAEVLKLVANRGRVVVLGDVGSPASQHLTSDVITRGLTIVGAHDCHTDERWNDRTISRYFFDLVTSGRFPLAGMTTHVFTPDRCLDAYGLANAKRGETMGITFDWTAELAQQPLGQHAGKVAGRAAPATAQ